MLNKFFLRRFRPVGGFRSSDVAFARRLWLLRLAVALIAPSVVGQPQATLKQSGSNAREIVLVEPESVTAPAVSRWKQEKFQAVAVILD